MKTVKVSDLSGPALDWAMAKCEGLIIKRFGRGLFYVKGADGVFRDAIGGSYSPSSEWSLAGPIIERERMCIDSSADGTHWLSSSRSNEKGNLYRGKTPLEAAMRSHVACKLGSVVEIPEELV